jgi:hypothetical protein
MFSRVAVVALSIFLSGNAAHAVMLEMSGSLTEIGPSLSSLGSVGDSFTATVTINPAVPDTNADTNVGTYAAIDSMVFRFNGNEYSMNPVPGRMDVKNDTVSGSAYLDQVLMICTPICATGPAAGGLSPIIMSLSFAETSPISSGIFPNSVANTVPVLDPLVLANFPQRAATLGFNAGSLNESIVATLTSVSVVPLPGAALFFLTGLAGVGTARMARRKFKQHR